MQERKINFAVCVHMMRWFDSHAAGGFNKHQGRNIWMILLQPHTHWNVVCYTCNWKKEKKKDQHTLKLRANGHNNFQHLVGSCNNSQQHVDLPTSRANIFSRAWSAIGRFFMFWGQLLQPEMRSDGIWKSLNNTQQGVQTDGEHVISNNDASVCSRL